MGICMVEAQPDGASIIRISGTAEAWHRGEFRAAYRRLRWGAPVIVDLTAAERLDTTALGMLLLIRRRAGGGPGAVRIIGACRDVRRFLATSHFGRLFKLEP
jgi:HptB-dependent secretion and biofilm anti anti-sigma factor